MMKALKTGLTGLAFGVVAALVIASPEASAQQICGAICGGGKGGKPPVVRQASPSASPSVVAAGTRLSKP